MRKITSFCNLCCIAFIVVLFTGSIQSCKKDDPAPNNNTNNPDFFKGNIGSQPWENGLVLRTNGTARYLYTFSGGSMSDTANSNVTKMEGTYNILANDSIYVHANDGVSDVNLAGLLNSAHTSIQGKWVFASGGIINTLTYSMSK